MKLLNSFYCDGVIISGEAFSEYTVKQLRKITKDWNENMSSFGVKPVSLKQDYKAIKKHYEQKKKRR